MRPKKLTLQAPRAAAPSRGSKAAAKAVYWSWEQTLLLADSLRSRRELLPVCGDLARRSCSKAPPLPPQLAPLLPPQLAPMLPTGTVVAAQTTMRRSRQPVSGDTGQRYRHDAQRRGKQLRLARA